MRGFGKDEQEEGQENVQVCLKRRFHVVELLLCVCGRCVFEKRGMEKTGGEMTGSKPFPFFPPVGFPYTCYNPSVTAHGAFLFFISIAALSNTVR